MIRFDDASRSLSLGVHDLLDADAPASNRRRGGSPTARMEAGRRAHQSWQSSRAKADPGFSSEVPVSCTRWVEGWRCRIGGRLDGLSQEGERWVVEEVKSCTLDGEELEALDDVGLAAWTRQVRLYLFFLEQAGVGPATGRLILKSQVDGWQRCVHVPPDPTLPSRLDAHLGWIVRWREDWTRHRLALAGTTVPFAHGVPRPGQEEMVAASRAAISRGRHLLVEAPTGVGKTAAILKGALEQVILGPGRLFFATARTTQQRLVEQTLRDMVGPAFPLRAIVVRAREKACLNQEVACHPLGCVRAREHGERMRGSGVVERLLDLGVIPADAVRDACKDEGLCPYQVAAELVPMMDVVVGDYSYVFDPFVMPARWFGEGAEPWTLLVDEVHNLPDRARAWFSAEIPADLLRAACRSLEGRGRRFHPYAELAADLAFLVEEVGRVVPDDSLPGVVEPSLEPFREVLSRMEEVAPTYVPWTGEEGHDPWLALLQSVSRFVGVAKEAGEESLWVRTDRLEPASPAADPLSPGLKVLCRDPSARLGARYAEMSGSVSFSATLRPTGFFREALGLDPTLADTVQVPGFFDPAHLRVVVDPTVSTRLKDRSRDRDRTARIVERVVAAIPGNCAVLFSSFALRDTISRSLRWEGREILVQKPSVSEAERDGLMDAIRRREGPPVVLLGVSGGIFAEGVDLPGDALVGVVVVGPALPAVSPEQEMVRDWYERRYRRGFLYAYLVPGMTRVVQAAGRVVRTPEDRGVVVLVDDRFARADHASFFPRDWSPVVSDAPWREVEAFFAEIAV